MAIEVATHLVEAARQGGQAEIEHLLEVVWPEAYRLARAIVLDRQGAEDAAQEACIILCRSISSLRSAAAFRVWFYRIVVREASELKRRHARIGPPYENETRAADETASIDLWRALSALPQKLRDVVVLRYFEDLSSREIASILRIPDGTVRFRLMVAMRRLRPLLGSRSENITKLSNEVPTNAI